MYIYIYNGQYNIYVDMCADGVRETVHSTSGSSKGRALTWYGALAWYCLSARTFAAPDDPLIVTGQQGRPSLACRQLTRV